MAGGKAPRLKPDVDRARRRLWSHDRRILNTDTEWLVGVDEVGRGALAGPVVAAAVALGPAFCSLRCTARDRSLFADSKQLDPGTREVAWERIQMLRREAVLSVALGRADVAVIDRYNILGATRLAMQDALETLVGEADGAWTLPPAEAEEMPLFVEPRAEAKSARLLIDGRPLKPFPYGHEGLIRGDSRSLAIALASIVAKVHRDRIMVESDARYEGYRFSDHKGYGTPQHWRALQTHGPSLWHRQTFLKALAAREA